MTFVCWGLELSFGDSSKLVLQIVYSCCVWETKVSLHLSLQTATDLTKGFFKCLIPRVEGKKERKKRFCLLNPPVSGKPPQPTVGWNNGWPLCHALSDQKQQSTIKTHNPHFWRTKSSLLAVAPASCRRNASHLTADSHGSGGRGW